MNRKGPVSAFIIETERPETMKTVVALVSTFALSLAVAPAFAQSATKMGQHSSWGTYSYPAKEGKVCYVLTVPTEKQPASLDHGDIYFFVSQRPGQKRTYEPQFIASYEMQANSKVSVSVGGKSFNMFVKGKSAWVEKPEDEPALIAAMRSGSDMKISARSKRGNPTSYTFSLKGISAALSSIQRCR